MRVLPGRKRTWAFVIGAGVLVVALLILAQPRARATLRLVHGFVEFPMDPRVRFEPEAEDLAKAIAQALPAVVARVEECQSGPFKRSFRVYVCASHESFASHISESANSPTRGIAFLRDVWISPRAFSFHGQDTHRQTLTHELSHLHLGQQLGWWHRTAGLPSWFQEGLADWVADTGEEIVSSPEAREAILNGQSIELDESGNLPFPKRPESYGMTWPMFHAQSRMFVEYLRSRDTNAFGRFVAAALRGVEFKTAINDNFGESVVDVWKDFRCSLESGTDVFR